MFAEAEKLGVEIMPSQFESLIRKLSSIFVEELMLAYPYYNKVLVTRAHQVWTTLSVARTNFKLFYLLGDVVNR